MFKNKCWPTTFHTFITTGEVDGWCPKWLVRSAPHVPWSHRTFRPIPTVKLLGIMFKNRCWPTTFHTITAGDVDGWCVNWPVWSPPHANTQSKSTHSRRFYSSMLFFCTLGHSQGVLVHIYIYTVASPNECLPDNKANVDFKSTLHQSHFLFYFLNLRDTDQIVNAIMKKTKTNQENVSTWSQNIVMCEASTRGDVTVPPTNLWGR